MKQQIKTIALLQLKASTGGFLKKVNITNGFLKLIRTLL